MRAARPDAFRNHTMPQTITLFHNPRCSKSRAALELLTARGADVEIVEYLKTPPSRDTLAAIVAKLGIDAGDLIRRGEDVFKGEYAGRTLSHDDALDAMAKHPILMERPIAVAGDRAVVGRPPEKVLTLLG
jgi:arsenate reductase